MQVQIDILKKMILINDKRITNVVQSNISLIEANAVLVETVQRHEERIKSLEFVTASLLKQRMPTTSRN